MMIIGLMSGTSADGIDAALVDVSGSGGRIRARLVHFVTRPHEPGIRSAILALCDPEKGRIPELVALSDILGRQFGYAALAVAESAGVEIGEVAAIASHGQTVWHQPGPLVIGGTEGRGTLQIGNPAVIAAVTGRRVISDFRSADMAAGGEGAPLVPFADWVLFRSGREARAVQNIGGIANVTYLPRSARLEDVRAFDTGPGNMVIDGVAAALTGGAKAMDSGGAWAAAGTVNAGLLKKLLNQAYFRRNPPKSTGREEFGRAYVEGVVRKARSLGVSDADLMATVTALTAESISRAYRQWLPGVKKVILGGGGVQNKTLVRMIGERLAPAGMTTHSELGIPDDGKEAVAFAILGYQTLKGRASNVPSATGARYAAVLGSITGPTP